jgi:UDP-2,4-diacetamido-2,4,6-trideoxy-beta-L-altropyranose hydrolase
MSSPATLIIRADGGVAMGTGHIMRCIALAQAWHDAGGICVLAVAEASPALKQRVQSEGIEVVSTAGAAGTPEDAAEFAGLAEKRYAGWVVSDGYQFGFDYQQRVKDAGLKLLTIDDSGRIGKYAADLVLDQNVDAYEKPYQDRKAYTRLLLGSRYAMLRREFARWRKWKREIDASGGKVLITMGGSDPRNLTPRVIQAFSRLHSNVELAVVVGGSNPNIQSVKDAAALFPGKIQLWENVPDMPDLMAWADIAVAGAGTTGWEMCLLGLPAILLDVADNQTPIALGLVRNGAALHVSPRHSGWEDMLAERARELLASFDDRQSMSTAGRRLIDGEGAARVVREMQGT